MRVILTFLAFLLLPNGVFALNMLQPAPGQENVQVDSFFRWEMVPGADKYVLDVQPFDESVDNISPSRCGGDGLCTFPFLEMPPGRTIQYLSSYTWSVTAYNPVGDPIGGPSGSRTFTTEQAPAGPPPPGGGGGGGGGSNLPVTGSGDLNPISQRTSQNCSIKYSAFCLVLQSLSFPSLSSMRRSLC